MMGKCTDRGEGGRMIKFRCEQCGQKIGVPEKLIGRHVKCPRCKHRQLVQAEGPAPGSVAALLAAEKTVADASATESAAQPERILRGQTLDLEDKPAERRGGTGNSAGAQGRPIEPAHTCGN